MWNIIVIIFCVVALLFNSFLWLKYRKNTDRKIQKKDGWNNYFFMTLLLLLTVLLNRIGKL
jgi:heme/copper-type cytochrome/quinol oxidase subunit 2